MRSRIAAAERLDSTLLESRQMNLERLLHEVEKRLEHLGEATRAQVIDALREEIARERRRLDPTGPVEAERERRVEAETLREILEAITRQARLEETIDEVLKQLGRLVAFDSCSVALRDPSGRLRFIATRGLGNDDRLVGKLFKSELTDAILDTRWPLSVTDVQEDPRWASVDGTPRIRSWAGIPLLVEGDVIGVLCLDRHRVDAFQDEDLHRAKAVAFSAAAAIRKAQLMEQIRRYAVSMERVVAVDQAVFSGHRLIEIAQAVLDGALQVGAYQGGLLTISGPGGPTVAVAAGAALANTQGRGAPKELEVTATTRLPPEQAQAVARALGVELPAWEMYLVPFATPDVQLGTLALVDPGGESPDDRLMEAFAARAAAAYLHALRRH
jgi:hypothetical protein